MRALVHDLRDLHGANQRAIGRLAQDATVEIDEIDDVLTEIDSALVNVRTLDQLFEKSDKATYLADRDRHGAVVRGLTAPRNAAVHFEDVVDPDISRAVGPIEGRFIVFPRWKQRSQIPPAAFKKTAPDALTAYDAAVAGRLLTDTLLDAIAFFKDRDDSLLNQLPDGQIEGLPLSPLPIGGYHRLHPDWPSHEQADIDIRASVTAVVPSGSKRLITGFVESSQFGIYLCGQTQVDQFRTQAFTEPFAQVEADVLRGYSYEAEVAGVIAPLEVKDNLLVLGSIALLESGLPNLSDTVPWSGWVEIAATDAAYYRSQRKFS